jgi:hypothetical protein
MDAPAPDDNLAHEETDNAAAALADAVSSNDAEQPDPFDDVTASPMSKRVWRTQRKLPFGFGPTCETIVGAAYVLAWIWLVPYTIALLICVAQVFANDGVLGLLVLGGAAISFVLYLAWIIVLARIQYVALPDRNPTGGKNER